VEKAMKLKGLCVYCSSEGVISCASCGAYVCKKHLAKSKNVCFRCTKGKLI